MGLLHAQGVKAHVIICDKKPARETGQALRLRLCDLCTDTHFTRKTHPLGREDLAEWVSLYRSANRHPRAATWHVDHSRRAGLTPRTRRTP